MWTAIKMLFDKRFGWRFKLANLIMGDRLRNYLAVGVSLPLKNALFYCDLESGEFLKHRAFQHYTKTELEKAKATVDEIFEM